MATLQDVQRRLIALGYNLGKSGADGALGPLTLDAAWDALNRLKLAGAPATPQSEAIKQPVLADSGLIPLAWLPWAVMARIIVHWTAGAHKANATDKKSYHILIEGDGTLIRGTPSIALNDAPVKPGYAAHTANLNGDSIGVSLCCMAGAKESPFDPGKYPLTAKQWETLIKVVAQISNRYAIPVTRKTVLSHAEVQQTLGVKQKGKWDISRLPFDPAVKGALAVGDKLRAAVAARL